MDIPKALNGKADDKAVHNEISGGMQVGPVLMGRDFQLELPPTIAPALSAMPSPTRSFTGRDDHISQLLSDLAPNQDQGQRAQVSAIAGLAGMGKTELAVQAAARALEQPGWFPGGVLFVDLAGYDPDRRVAPEQALYGLLRALSIPPEHIPPDVQDRQRLYRSAMAAYAKEGKRILVIVDNASTAAQARPLLPTDGTTAALVTSRHTLDGLEACHYDLAQLDERPSRCLLDRALREARGDRDTRFADDPDATAAIARMCAGLPLALRIAAATLIAAPARPAAALATALTAEHTRLDKLRRPDGANLNASERAVRAAFDLSYRLLGEDHARLFRLLPLNPGPDVSTEAAAQLASDDLDDVEDLLQQLTEAHLVEPGRTWGRWRLHDLVRLYADEHGQACADADQRAQAILRLFTHYRDTAEAADTHVDTRARERDARFRHRDDALAWLDAERTSLTSVALAAPNLGHPALALALSFALARYLTFRRRFDDSVSLARAAAAVAAEQNDPTAEACAWNNLGSAWLEARQFEEAITALTRAAGTFQDLSDRHNEVSTWNNLGVALREVRRFEEAITALTRAAGTSRDLDDKHNEARASNNLGLALQEVRQFEEAIAAHTRAALLYQELGDRHGEASAWNNLGNSLREVHRFEEAITALTRAARLYRELGDQHGEATAWTNLGLALKQVHRFEEAITALTRAADTFQELGELHNEASAWNNLGGAWLEVDQAEKAIAALTRAAGLYQELGDRHSEASAGNNLGVVLRGVRQFDEAIIALAGAADIFQELGDCELAGVALDSLAVAHNERWRRTTYLAVDAAVTLNRPAIGS
ncbi:tetratricopeptide repeat protein [Streptomyces aureus]